MNYFYLIDALYIEIWVTLDLITFVYTFCLYCHLFLPDTLDSILCPNFAILLMHLVSPPSTLVIYCWFCVVGSRELYLFVMERIFKLITNHLHIVFQGQPTIDGFPFMPELAL